MDCFSNPLFHWAFPEKKTNGQLWIWNFYGYQRNGMWNFHKLIKMKQNFQAWPRKNHAEFPGVFTFGIGISMGYNAILWNFEGWSSVLSGTSRGKVKKERNSRVFSKKLRLQAPHLFFFFWNCPLWNKLPPHIVTIVNTVSMVHSSDNVFDLDLQHFAQYFWIYMYIYKV